MDGARTTQSRTEKAILFGPSSRSRATSLMGRWFESWRKNGFFPPEGLADEENPLGLGGCRGEGNERD